MNDTPLTGSCLCGTIRYQVTQIASKMAHCHCSMCRKFHGAAFSTFCEAKKEDFQWLTGEDKLRSYIAPNGTCRQFCNDCGSSMTFASSDATGELIEFATATLDCDLPANPDAHIYTESQVDWFDPNDGLPKYKAGRE